MPDTIAELMRRAAHARRESCLADAHRDLTEAVVLSRQDGARRELILALKALGQIERDLGRGDSALPLYEDAVALCREEGEPLLLAHTLRHLGDLHQDAGRLAEARPCYDEALNLYRGQEGAPLLDLANAVRPLALLNEKEGDRNAAKALWEEARDLYARAQVDEGVAECSARLSGL